MQKPKYFFIIQKYLLFTLYISWLRNLAKCIIILNEVILMQELNVRIRLTEDEVKLLEHTIKTNGYMGTSEYLTEIIRNKLRSINDDDKKTILQGKLTEDDILDLIRKNINNIAGKFQFADLLIDVWTNVSFSQRKRIGKLFRRMVEDNEFPGVIFLGPNPSGIALYERIIK